MAEARYQFVIISYRHYKKVELPRKQQGRYQIRSLAYQTSRNLNIGEHHPKLENIPDRSSTGCNEPAIHAERRKGILVLDSSVGQFLLPATEGL